MLDCLQILFAKGTQGVCGGVEEICDQWSVAGSEAREEDRVRLAASSHTNIGPREPVMHVRCPRTSQCWMYKCPADEGSRGCIGNGPRRVVDG